MSLEKFELLVRGDGVGQNDQVWFPKWLRRYAMSFPNGMFGELPVNRDAVIRFSTAIRKNGAPAWQRYQAVRAIETYKNLVLRRTEPDLSDVIRALAGLAKGERNLEIDAPPTAEELRQLQGNINRAEPQLVQTIRGEMRVLHYSYATEKAYVRWVKRFSTHVGFASIQTHAKNWRGSEFSLLVSVAETSGAAICGGTMSPRSSLQMLLSWR